MTILNTISLESNKQIKIYFNGRDLSSDGGLLLIKEFAARVGLIKLVKKLFKTIDHTTCRMHTDSDNDVYKSDYETITTRILEEEVSYEAAVEAIRTIAESGMFDGR